MLQKTQIALACRSIGCDVRENAIMAEYTSFHIGGYADLLVTADSNDKVQRIKKLCAENNVPLMLIGNGSNLLVSDNGIRGVVLKLDGRFSNPEIQNGVIICHAGLPLKSLCRFARDNGLSGLEFAYGIPGTVGGAVYMNAGAYCGQISNVINWAEAVYPDGEVYRVQAEDMKLGYRHSVFMENRCFITSAAFRLKPDESHVIGQRMDEFMRLRRDKQPLEYPSAGSFFKRPKGYFAGALIEGSGLKGCRVGGAQVSEKHAGFIINLGGATSNDVLKLADQVINKVFCDHGVRLQPEVCFVG